MAFVPATNTLEIQMVYQQDSQTCENVYHLKKATAWTGPDIAALSDIITTWEFNGGGKIRTTGSVLQKLLFRDLTTETSPRWEVMVDPTVPGEVGGVVLPLNVAFSVKLATGRAGRWYRGRSYRFGHTQLTVVGDRVTATYKTNLDTALNALKHSWFVAGYTWSVVSKYVAGAPRTAALVTAITTLGWVDDVTDSQRRRLPGRGN